MCVWLLGLLLASWLPPASSQTPQSGLWECLFKCEPDLDECYWKGICKSGSGMSPLGACTQRDYDAVCGLGVPFYPQQWMHPAAFYGDDMAECQAALETDASSIPCVPDATSKLVWGSSSEACPIVEEGNWRDCNSQNPYCWWCELDSMCTEGGAGGRVAPTNYDPKCGMPPGVAASTAVLSRPRPADNSSPESSLEPSIPHDSAEWVCTYICDGQSVFRCMDSCPRQYAGCELGQSYQVTSSNCETFIERMQQYGGSDFATRQSADVSVAGRGLMMAVQDHLSKHLQEDGSLAVQIRPQDIQQYLEGLEEAGLSAVESSLCQWAGGTVFCPFIVNNPLMHYVNRQVVRWPVAQDLTHSVVDLTSGDVQAAVGDVVDAVNTGAQEVEDVCKKAGHAISNFVRNIFSVEHEVVVV